MTAGLIVCAAVLAGTTALGIVWRRRSGVLREVGHASPAPSAGAAPHATAHTAGGTRRTGRAAGLTAARLGQPLGPRATLVHFSTAFCSPCRATRRILADVAAMAHGVAHIEIDAESHLSLVRELGIVAVPTVLVLGPDGAILRRGTGQPRKADVIGALGGIQPGGTADAYGPGPREVTAEPGHT